MDAASDREDVFRSSTISLFQNIEIPQTLSTVLAAKRPTHIWDGLFGLLRYVPAGSYADSERMLLDASRAVGIFADARRITSSSAGANSSGGIPPTAT
jgi:hypothetical protein